jgi:hypothetical protein
MGCRGSDVAGRDPATGNDVLRDVCSLPETSESGTLGEILRRAIYGNAAYRPEIESC